MRGARIETRAELGSIPPIDGDAPSVREMLTNLVFNAIDALSGGGTIVVKTWATEDRVHCAVCDTGTGMSELVKERALEPFFTTKGPQRTGLGLSVAYGIIQRSGGELTIESAEGRGTTIAFHLPLTAARQDVPSAVPADPFASCRILLIDDESTFRTAVAELLSVLGATVVEAKSGREGLVELEHGPPVDLVLTDLGMPGMNGWAVAHAVKTLHPSLPVGLITGWGEDSDHTAEDRMVVDFTLVKPVTIDTLRSAIARIHSRGSLA